MIFNVKCLNTFKKCKKEIHKKLAICWKSVDFRFFFIYYGKDHYNLAKKVVRFKYTKSTILKRFYTLHYFREERGLNLKAYIEIVWEDILDNKEVITLLTFIWMILFEQFSLAMLLFSVVISILVDLFTDRFLLRGNYEHSYVIGTWTSIKYIFRLIIEIYLAGIDVIPTIIKGDAHAEIVRTETKLTDELLIDLLANSITLTPGTVTVEKRGSELLVLNLNALAEDEDGRAVIPEKIEKIFLDYEAKIEGKA